MQIAQALSVCWMGYWNKTYTFWSPQYTAASKAIPSVVSAAITNWMHLELGEGWDEEDGMVVQILITFCATLKSFTA